MTQTLYAHMNKIKIFKKDCSPPGSFLKVLYFIEKRNNFIKFKIFVSVISKYKLEGKKRKKITSW
jgi:hypothetical protein